MFLLAFITINLLSEMQIFMQYNETYNMVTKKEFSLECFRTMNIEKDVCKAVLDSKKSSTSQVWDELTMAMLIGKYCGNDKGMREAKKVLENDRMDIAKSKFFTQLRARYEAVLRDIKYFPVVEDVNQQNCMTFENSWGEGRTYGGNRRHEGTDIMPPKNVRGVYPIISVSDGVVENLGWLEQGGYRIGVRSAMGGYYYYAHLDSYITGIEKGSKVMAGQVLGFMGDTGYGKKEGTRGQFPVHLHFGIYYMENGEETSVNPYYILTYLEDKKIRYNILEKQ